MEHLDPQEATYHLVPPERGRRHNVFRVDNNTSYQIGYSNISPLRLEYHQNGWGRRNLQDYSEIPLRPPYTGWVQRPLGYGRRDIRVPEWEGMEDTLRRLYIDLNQKGAETIAILELVYSLVVPTSNFGLAKSRAGLRVNNGQREEQQLPAELGEAPTKRGRLGTRDKDQRLAWFELLLQDCFVQDLRAAMKDKSASWAVPIIRSPDSYLHQEKMLASVHDYIFSIFKSPNWTFTSTDMLDPTGSTDTDRAWKRLSDQVWGAGSLFRGPSRNAGSTKLKRIILDMEQIVGSDDPQFMVRIWRICRYLHGICASTGDERHLKAHFLHRLRDSLKARTGERSPVFRFFDALSSMDTDCFLWALRIGNWRAMQCFERVIGAGHPLVLTMWVYYSKQWRVADKSYGEIIEYYSNALQSADESLRRDSDTAISILHDYTYFVHYSAAGKANAQAATLANDLYERTWTRMLDANCTWDNKTQYFTFASQVLAEHWNALGNWYNASGYLEKASGLLQVADRECKVRAGMLLGRLQRWWEHWGRPEEAEGVRQRQEALQASVDRLLQEEIQTERAS